jgi:hypothetical protein
MTPFENEIEQRKVELYWRKNAPLTCAVLSLATLASVVVYPMSFRSVGGGALAGLLLHLASLSSERRHTILPHVLLLSGLALGVWALLATSPMRTSLGWVQALASFGASLSWAKVFHNAVQENPDPTS